MHGQSETHWRATETDYAYRQGSSAGQYYGPAEEAWRMGRLEHRRSQRPRAAAGAPSIALLALAGRARRYLVRWLSGRQLRATAANSLR